MAGPALIRIKMVRGIWLPMEISKMMWLLIFSVFALISFILAYVHIDGFYMLLALIIVATMVFLSNPLYELWKRHQTMDMAIALGIRAEDLPRGLKGVVITPINPDPTKEELDELCRQACAASGYPEYRILDPGEESPCRDDLRALPEGSCIIRCSFKQ